MAENSPYPKRGTQAPQDKKHKARLSGVGYWVILCLAIIKDISDLVFTLTIFLAPLGSFTSLFVNAIIFIYLHLKGVRINGRNVSLGGAIVIGEITPILNIFGFTTLGLIAIRYLEK